MNLASLGANFGKVTANRNLVFYLCFSMFFERKVCLYIMYVMQDVDKRTSLKSVVVISLEL